jgi:type IV pilus assembly protein PilN
MLVEINLLPKKENTKSSQLMITLVILLLVAVSSAIIYLQGNSYQSKIKSVDNETASVQKLNAVEQKKLTSTESGNSGSKLKDAVTWVQQYPFETVPLLREIITLLPERGFIQKFDYTKANSVIIKIQFDESREAAFYLSSLKHAEWVREVTILNVMAVTEEEANTDNNLKEEKVIPRYSAEYEITFKPELFKQNSEGVTKGGDGT